MCVWGVGCVCVCGVWGCGCVCGGWGGVRGVWGACGGSDAYLRPAEELQ